ncbi:MAG: bifunctional diaminohydroxyphosphoribosylaminopyrimidine deaminase/5-amino-6-(5-phosphoribosylamino)uracil reductase RibD [Bacteroidales bacterium]
MEGNDEKYMRRCIDLASRAAGNTFPNPMVGAVIVHQDNIIGEGYHLKAGQPHAEVNAINSVTDRSKLASSVLYVSLEPCSHFGKTPPCADLIISMGIPEVVVGATDTSAKVSGAGIKRLRDAGIKVRTGVLGEECRWLNRRFFSWHERSRPYIILKWASSADGFIDINRSESAREGPNWISGKPERVLVHRWRAMEQAILAGANTIRVDNPGLDVRYWTGDNPLKVILSRSGELGKYFSENVTKSKAVAFTSFEEVKTGNAEKILLAESVPAARQISDNLHSRGIQSLLVEGGAMVLQHFINEGLWDEARIFTGKMSFGEGVRAPVIEGVTRSVTRFTLSTLDVIVNESPA